MTRYPIGPLLTALGCRTINQARARHGLQLWAYADRGLSEDHADRLAVTCGLHPALVWPDWVDNGLTALDRVWLDQGWRQAWLWREDAA